MYLFEALVEEFAFEEEDDTGDGLIGLEFAGFWGIGEGEGIEEEVIELVAVGGKEVGGIACLGEGEVLSFGGFLGQEEVVEEGEFGGVGGVLEGLAGYAFFACGGGGEELLEMLGFVVFHVILYYVIT